MNPPATTQLMNGGLGASPEASSGRVRVALLAAAGSTATDDLYRLLRRRLLTFSSILAAASAAGIVTDLIAFSGRGALHDVPSEIPIAVSDLVLMNWRSHVMLAVSGVSTLLLWKRPPRSVVGLRVIELLIVGTLSVMFLISSVGLPYRTLEAAARYPAGIRAAFVQRYSNAGSLVWFVIITLYGTLIPNTCRRCLAVTGIIAASPSVLFAVYGLWLRPLEREIFLEAFTVIAFNAAFAVAVAAFSSSRIEVLRRQAAEARRLGQYVLADRLGGGGMGEVYLARHALLRRPCAIKVIRPERAGDPENLRRFEREVQATAALTHPNTVQVFDYGHAEDGTFYYVMEYLSGLTLEELVTREGPLEPDRAVRLLRQVCGALAEAHGRGLIHRDVKPGNVMVCDRGGVRDVAKLLDFGLVLPPPSDLDGDEKLTRAGTMTGTPGYVSPEQARGGTDLDARSDVYGVGALAYFLLTGRPPFRGRTPVETLAAHLYEVPRPLRDVRPEVPPALEAVVLRCLTKDPGGRYADAGELDTALAAVACATVPTGRPRLSYNDS